MPPTLYPGETTFGTATFRPDRSGQQSIQLRVVVYEDENVSLTPMPVFGRIVPPSFEMTFQFTIKIPTTHMNFGNGDLSTQSEAEINEILRSGMFWAIYAESSQGRFENYLPTNLPCIETPNPEVFLSPNVRTIDHCTDYRQLYASAMLNGFLEYERKNGSPNTANVFGYLPTNFGGSLGNGTFTFWIAEDEFGRRGWGYPYQDCRPTYAEIGINNRSGQGDDGLSPYIAALDEHTSYGASWNAAANWVHYYLQCIKGSFGSIKDANNADFYTPTMSQISSAVSDFPDLDASNAAFSARSANREGITDGFPTEIVAGDKDAAYNNHVTFIGSNYFPDGYTVLQPVITSDGRLWISLAFTQSNNPLYIPR